MEFLLQIFLLRRRSLAMAAAGSAEVFQARVAGRRRAMTLHSFIFDRAPFQRRAQTRPVPKSGPRLLWGKPGIPVRSPRKGGGWTQHSSRAARLIDRRSPLSRSVARSARELSRRELEDSAIAEHWMVRDGLRSFQGMKKNLIAGTDGCKRARPCGSPDGADSGIPGG